MKISGRIALLMLDVLVGVVACLLVGLLQMRSPQFDGRVVNHAGIVRGATQRLVKLELAGRPSDELIAKLDRIIGGLIGRDDELI